MANNDWLEIEIEYNEMPENVLETLSRIAEKNETTLEETIIEILSKSLKKLEEKNGY